MGVNRHGEKIRYIKLSLDSTDFVLIKRAAEEERTSMLGWIRVSLVKLAKERLIEGDKITRLLPDKAIYKPRSWATNPMPAEQPVPEVTPIHPQTDTGISPFTLGQSLEGLDGLELAIYHMEFPEDDRIIDGPNGAMLKPPSE